MNQNKNSKMAKNKLMELKDSDSIEFFVGFLSFVIFSKDLFKSNLELYSFVKKAFKIEFKNYVIASRTLMFSRIAREITNKSDEYDFSYAKNFVIGFINEKINEQLNEELSISMNKKEKNTKINSKKSKNTTTESISKWIKGLRGE